MKRIVYVLAFITTLGLKAQVSVNSVNGADTVFYIIYGGPQQEEATDFAETPDKGFLICGSSSSYGQGTSSAYLVKTDSLGKYKWSKTYGGGNADIPKGLVITPDNGAIVAGYSNSYNDLTYDAYYFKIDNMGNIIWEHALPGNDWDFINAIALMPDSGAVMVGKTYTNSAGDADAWLIRINKNGDTLWTKKFGGPYEEEFNSVVLMNNKIYAAGRVYDNTKQVYRGLMAGFDFNGNLSLNYALNGSDTLNYTINGINSTHDNYLIMIGQMDDPNAALQNEFRLKSDNLFNITERDSSPIFAPVRSGRYFFEDNRNHLMAVMNSYGGNGGSAFFIGDHLDANYYLYGFTYGGADDDTGVKGLITSRNTLAFLGNTYSYNPGGSGYGDEEYWLILFKADTIVNDHTIKFYYHTDTISLAPFAIEEIQEADGIRLFPNPVAKNATLYLTSGISGKGTVELMDLQGRQLLSTELSDLKNASFPLADLNLSNGLYFVRITNDTGSATFKISVQD